MLKTMKIFYVILLTLIVLTSCRKEELPRPNNDNSVVEVETNIEGATWVLTEGRVYVENIDTGEKRVYDYFGGGVTSSFMHIFGSTPVVMDSIKQNFTTWTFNNGTFTLNGAQSWNYTEYNDSYNVIGLTGGTARNIRPTHTSEDYITVVTHEAYGSDGTYNYNYYSELGFSRAGTSCTDCQPGIGYGWVYSGVWTYSGTNEPTIRGTKWVLSRYNNGLSGNVYPNDTLEFVTDTKYTINGGSEKVYVVSNVIGNNNKSLSLYSLTTLGGDYSGQIIGSYLDDGFINNAQFVDMFNVNNTVTIWMNRIQ
jgi:hypothetical protein